jgi:hypothetical protein
VAGPDTTAVGHSAMTFLHSVRQVETVVEQPAGVGVGYRTEQAGSAI